MLKAEGCLLMMTHQRKWGVNCMGGTGEPFKKLGPILPWEVSRAGNYHCFTDKETESRGSHLDLTLH